MKRLVLLFLLFIGCENFENHGDLSIFKDPTPEQVAEWSIIDSIYKTTITDMVNVYKRSSKLNFNGNPWENREFQREYSDNDCLRIPCPHRRAVRGSHTAYVESGDYPFRHPGQVIEYTH